jgi:hypothetical protein
LAYNVPSYDTQNLSFGPGVLYLCGLTAAGAAGITEGQLSDVGAVNSGSSFQVTRTRLDVFQGSPKSLIDTFVTQEDAQLSVTGIEWNLSNLALALGAGLVTSSGVTTTFSFGGDLKVSDVAAKFVHVTPYGTTVTIRLWKAEGMGDLNVSFGDAIHEVPYTFKALESATKWGGSALGVTERLFSMELVTAS